MKNRGGLKSKLFFWKERDSFSKKKKASWKDRYFPERQLFLRSEGHVRFVTFGSRTQMVITAGILGLFSFGGYNTYGYISSDAALVEKKQEIANISNQYQTLSGDFNTLEQLIEKRAAELEGRQKLLESLVTIQDAEKPNAEVLDNSLPSTESSDTKEPADKNDISIDDPGDTTYMQAATINNGNRREQLIARLNLIEAAQRVTAQKMLSNFSHGLAEIDRAIEKTPVNTKGLISKSLLTARGGPFIADENMSMWTDTETGQLFDNLFEESNRLDIAMNALVSFPTGKPAEKYYVSSRFGSRKDPFTKKWARHSGLDMAGWPGTGIIATAAGEVIKSGWHGPYGQMIEIDHGNGFHTRYGHMRKLHVKVGEMVTLDQRIGDMGKTGRATSSHLHYEIWYNGKVRDPLPFMKAAKDVIAMRDNKNQFATE